MLSRSLLLHHFLSFVLLSILILSGSCTGPSGQSRTLVQERSLQAGWEKNRLTLMGSVLDSRGEPLSGVELSLGDALTVTDMNGDFLLENIARVNGVLSLEHNNYYSENLALNLQLPATITSVALPPIKLQQKQDSQVRFIFGGDVSFGRRFLDPDETTPRDQIPADNPAALIQASDPAPGTKAVMQWVKPWYRAADWSVLNLETPVTDNPSTPHTEKPFAFFTLPASLEALTDMGVDYVSLGNNHVYDYLDIGLADSLRNVAAAGINYSGAGLTPDDAWKAFRTQIKGQKYAFISATSVAGDQYGINFVATDSKGGAADLRDKSRLTAAIQAERDAGYLPIIQWHTGKEYTYTPTDYAAGRLQLAADNGAALIVSHHPHVAQGVSLRNNVLTLEGLGNLAFDQSRLETFLGLVARVDMSADQVNQLRLLPVYLKEFAPLPVTGDLANRFLRRIAEYSSVLVYPYQSQGFVDLKNNATSEIQTSQTVSVTLPDSGVSIIDLRAYAVSEASLAMIETAAPVVMKMGRDLMLFGDFEDWDGNNRALEASHWDITGDSRFVCMSNAMRGLTGLCTVRDSRHEEDTVLAFRNRIRVMGNALNKPNKALSLLGYVKQQNSGPLSIVARYYASEGEQTFGEEEVYSSAGGDADWTVFSADLNMPAEARAARIFIHHAPPAKSQATAAFDELAVVNWEETVASGEVINTPHARDFVRLEGEPGTEINLKLNFVRYTPAN